MRKRQDHLDVLAACLLVFCCVVWGIQQVLIKATVSEVPPLWQATIRFAGATVLLWVWSLARGHRLFERDGTLGAGMLAGVLFAGEFACVYLGARDTTASRLTVYLYTAPFVVAALLPLLIPIERLRRPQWLGLVLAFGGIVYAFSAGLGPAANPNQLRGDILALMGGTLWGFTTLVIRSSSLSTVSAEKILFYQVAVTAGVAPLLSLALGERWSLAYTASAWGSIAYQTVLGAFATMLVWMWLLRYYPATRISAFSFLTPVFALIFGVVLLHETVTTELLVGTVGVSIGIVLVNRRVGVRDPSREPG